MSVDTIIVEIPKIKVEELTGKKITVDNFGEVLYESGYKDCIRVIHKEEVTRLECSLPRLLKRNNVYCLSHLGIMEAIRKMEETLNVSLEDGIVRRIDLCVNVNTSYSPVSYFRFFTEAKYFERSLIKKTSLYFTNNNREIYLYDKIKEMIAKRIDVPDNCVKKNLMRIEYRIKNTYIKDLFGKRLLVKDLYSKETMMTLIDDFTKVYLDIYREKKASINLTNSRLVKEFQNALMNEGIKANGGIDGILELINDFKLRNPDLRKEYFSKLKAKAKAISSMNGLSHDEDCIIELDEKFKRGYDEFKATFQ